MKEALFSITAMKEPLKLCLGRPYVKPAICENLLIASKYFKILQKTGEQQEDYKEEQTYPVFLGKGCKNI